MLDHSHQHYFDEDSQHQQARQVFEEIETVTKLARSFLPASAREAIADADDNNRARLAVEREREDREGEKRREALAARQARSAEEAVAGLKNEGIRHDQLGPEYQAADDRLLSRR
jgi:hypothetical protein